MGSRPARASDHVTACRYLLHRSHRPFYDITLHRPEGAEKLGLLVLSSFGCVQCGDEVAYESVEVAAADTHAGMGAFHASAGVSAGSAGGLANLIDQLQPESVRANPRTMT